MKLGRRAVAYDGLDADADEILGCTVDEAVQVRAGEELLVCQALGRRGWIGDQRLVEAVFCPPSDQVV